jgi:ribonucleotide monophosphatase NagD (HAD superfamily)
MRLNADLAARLRDAAGFIFDMDGTIALGDSKSGGHRALPHAIAVLETLKAAGTPFVVFTNGTAKPPAAYAQSLRNAGFP